jgi:aromatic-L-amino-acid/L-tryptophan decarboxylase
MDQHPVGEGTDADPLALSAEQMREIGYRTIDRLVERLADTGAPAMRRAAPRELQAQIAAQPPPGPRCWDEVLSDVETNVLDFTSRLAHPAYFAFIPASCTFPGALADLIAGALDIDAGSWSSAAGPSQLELVVLDWFKSWIGYPSDAGGVLVGGGSAANLTALACARETLAGSGSSDGVIYASAHAHSSVTRAARLLGFGPEQVIGIPTDRRFRLRVDALLDAVALDRDAGRRPLIVVANAGATNTGAVDPLGSVADVCAEHGLWLHVDAAYGGFAALTDRGRATLAGLERAESVTLDPHKWLYQPIECGSVLVRRPGLLERAFAVAPDYLEDYRGGEVDFCDRGLQLTRSARALKIWMSINAFGLSAFIAAIDRSLDLAQLAERLIRLSPSLELLCPATLGVVCFRRRLQGLDDEGEIAQVNTELTARFEASGQGLISSTRLDGRYALRLCVMNHTSSAEDVKRTIRWLAEIPVLHGASKPGHGQRARTARRPAAPRLALGTDRGS